jgi:group 4 capsule polysaccharide lipoprotein GfcB/YjbF
MGAVLEMKLRNLPLAGVFLLAVVGCGNSEQVDAFSSFWNGGKSLVSSVGRSKEAPSITITPEMLSQVGEPVISAVGRNFAMGFIQVSTNGPFEQWRSTPGQGMTFRNGILYATRGLGDDLMNLDLEAGIDAFRNGREGSFVRIHRYLNSENRIDIDSFVCTIQREGSEIVELAGKGVNARKVSERCTGEDLRFENLFWFEIKSGRMVASRQWVSRKVGYVDLKYYAM